MMRTKWLAFISITILATSLWAQTAGYQADRALFERVCTSCHDCGWFLWPRSFKGWELTVDRMQTRAHEASGYSDDGSEGGKSFTDEEAERIVTFLTDFVGQGALLDAEGEPGTEPDGTGAEYEGTFGQASVPDVELPPTPDLVEPVLAEVVEPATPDAAEPVVAAAQSLPVSASTPHVGMPPSDRAMKRLWNPSMQALVWARVSGFAAVACLLGLLFSGFKRRTLKRHFRNVHVALALGLFVTLAIHGTVYIFEYGTPHVLWYWFGLIGFGALVTTELQGIVRKRFHKGLLISHITGACVGLVLSILHWVWAWL
ncbi:MAG: hypothetical protein HN919_18015 [Verrucomicrobia bacterium]|jgi:hypothetical protein|nr:hypothetical protein [Verrucomicrobiota bacterium]MBT7700948.1 hypothetical protein [Verrucomicrobiota bacterium]